LNEITLELYYDKSSTYREDLSMIRELCYKLESNYKVTIHQIEKSTLSGSMVEAVENEIRGLIPQQRGSIVTSRGFLLPLSNSKHLNLGNTPVLLVKSKGKLVYVFPCLLGDRYYNVAKGIEHVESTMPRLPPLSGLMEESLIFRVLANVATHRQDLTLLGKELETSAGRADLVFLDKERSHIIVEVEREATDCALGQVLRLCAAYERKAGLPRQRVKAVLACERIHEFVRRAADRAVVEVWSIPKDMR
jgi:hypothetical protein